MYRVMIAPDAAKITAHFHVGQLADGRSARSVHARDDAFGGVDLLDPAPPSDTANRTGTQAGPQLLW